jgi:murein peptide amidase A
MLRSWPAGVVWNLTLAVAVASSARPGVSAPPTDGETPPINGQLVGRSLEGRPIYCQVFGEGEDVLWILATIHGNEAAGTPLVAKFAEWLGKHPEELDGRQVIIVPVANPDGFAANIRHNKNDVDLNRNFPAGNFDAEVKIYGSTPLSEPESRALMRVLMQYFPDRVVSIHQPLNCMDWDGDASEPLAQAMAARCKLPAKRVGSRPGSLGSFVGLTLGRPIITMELPEDAGMDGEKLWQEYGESLIAALRYKGK